MIKTILVCGGRYYGNRALVFKTLDTLLTDRGWHPSDIRVITGGASGADSLGIQWAKDRGAAYKPYYADWDDLSHPNAVIKRRKNGKKYDALAGHRRNQKMLDREHPLVVVAFPGGTGTADMISRAKIEDVEVLMAVTEDYETKKPKQHTLFS